MFPLVAGHRAALRSVFKHTEISNCSVLFVFLEACHCAELALG